MCSPPISWKWPSGLNRCRPAVHITQSQNRCHETVGVGAIYRPYWFVLCPDSRCLVWRRFLGRPISVFSVDVVIVFAHSVVVCWFFFLLFLLYTSWSGPVSLIFFLPSFSRVFLYGFQGFFLFVSFFVCFLYVSHRFSLVLTCFLRLFIGFLCIFMVFLFFCVSSLVSLVFFCLSFVL